MSSQGTTTLACWQNARYAKIAKSAKAMKIVEMVAPGDVGGDG